MVKVVNADYKILSSMDGLQMLRQIEYIARTCYKSEDKISDDGESAKRIVKTLVNSGHESTIEHCSVTVRLTCDVGFYKDLTRHRIASFSIESTRYCMYAGDKFGGEISVIKPANIPEGTPEYAVWLRAQQEVENAYKELAAMGARPDVCRMLLTHSTKADVNITANLREWRHIFQLRTSTFAHPSLWTLLTPLLREFRRNIPVIFDDIDGPDMEKIPDWGKAEIERIEAAHI